MTAFKPFAPDKLNITSIFNGSWTLTNGDTGIPVEIANYSDKSAHFFTTTFFGTGGSVTMRGSNDPRVITDLANYKASGNLTYTETADWQPLVDPQGNTITKTSASIEQLLENPRFLSPKCTAGDGTTSIAIAICAKKAN